MWRPEVREPNHDLSLKHDVLMTEVSPVTLLRIHHSRTVRIRSDASVEALCWLPIHRYLRIRRGGDVSVNNRVCEVTAMSRIPHATNYSGRQHLRTHPESLTFKTSSVMRRSQSNCMLRLSQELSVFPIVGIAPTEKTLTSCLSLHF